MSVANQKIVCIHKPKYQRDFLQIGIQEWQDARKALNYSELALYLYLAGNANGYNLELSQKAVENAIGIKKTAYHDAVKKLRVLGFLTGAYGNVLDFHTRAVRPSGQGEAEKIRPDEWDRPPPRTAPAAKKEKEVRSSNREIDKINNQIDRTDKSVPQKEKEGGEEERAVQVYLVPLSDKRKQEFASFARGLNKSWAWIRKAIEQKSIAVWERYGFGLLKIEDYIKQIDELIREDEKQAAALKAKQEQIAEMIEKQMNTPHEVIRITTPEPRKPRPQIDLNSIGITDSEK
jgi:hypothetical protein